MAVVDISNIGVGDVNAGGGIGQFNPANPVAATQQDAASLFESQEGGSDTEQFGQTTTTTTDTSNAVAVVPQSRNISFTITSSPIGASIFIDGVDSLFTTPHTINFLETELLTPKVVSVVNGTNQSIERYIISSEVFVTETKVPTNTNTQVVNNNSTSGGGSAGGGASQNNDPSDRRTFRYEIDGGSRERGNTQR